MWYTEEITHRGTSSLGKLSGVSRAGPKRLIRLPALPQKIPFATDHRAEDSPQVFEDPHKMTSCQQTACSVKILLLLSLVLPVTPDSSTASPSATTEPASPEVFTTSTSNKPEADQATEEGMHASTTTKQDMGIDDGTTAAEHEDVLDATEANNATIATFTVLTTLLTGAELTTTDEATTSLYQTITRRSETTLEDTIHGRAKDETRRLENERIFSYDYRSLRQWGLICALLLCIIGFLVLFSGRCRGKSCRRRQKRRYNIAGV
ncbi:uncharacterized protein LOC143933466 isoform X1 [Lithobates pipiens]